MDNSNKEPIFLKLKIDWKLNLPLIVAIQSAYLLIFKLNP